MQCVGPPSFGGVCRTCIACRLNYAAMWAVRGSHERSLWDVSCSITLTYDDDHVPWSGLQKKHFQDFLKRLRRQLSYYKMSGADFKYIACGEYGDESGVRSTFGHPHFHAVFFGLDFPDKYKWRKGKLGHQMFRSDFLEKQWTFGNAEIGGADDEMINYVCAYVTKKVTGQRALSHYASRRFCDEMGNHFDFLYNSEFFLSSRRPAIGLRFLEDNFDDIFAHDEVILAGGVRKPVPQYYANKLRERSEILYQSVRHDRLYSARDRFQIKANDALTSRKLDRKLNLEARLGLYK